MGRSAGAQFCPRKTIKSGVLPPRAKLVDNTRRVNSPSGPQLFKNKIKRSFELEKFNYFCILNHSFVDKIGEYPN